MKIETLVSFQQVLSSGSFAEAAQVLNLTPSAVSQQMKQLEEYVGQPLFDRSARRVVPTPHALQIARPMAEALALLKELHQPRRSTVAGLLRLGVIGSVEKSALPRVLRLMRTNCPDLAIRLSLDVSPALINAVKAGRLDAALLIRPASGGSSRLAWTNLVRESFVILASASTAEASPAELLRCMPWIRYDPGLTGGRIASDWVRKVAPDAVASFDIISIEAIMAMVSEGLGVSVVPRPGGPVPIPASVRMSEIGPDAPTRQVALLVRRADAEDRRIRAFTALVRQVYADMPQSG
jgi:DNA-binding transcriptional LysR family regulator